jgi:hypothetical protein
MMRHSYCSEVSHESEDLYTLLQDIEQFVNLSRPPGGVMSNTT